MIRKTRTSQTADGKKKQRAGQKLTKWRLTELYKESTEEIVGSLKR
jgi:hypothetical protein